MKLKEIKTKLNASYDVIGVKRFSAEMDLQLHAQDYIEFLIALVEEAEDIIRYAKSSGSFESGIPGQKTALSHCKLFLKKL